MIGEGEGNKASYIEHIGLFFFFVACAGISIIVWIFNWICWLNQCCCCDFLHNPINKRLVWWTSFIFALGILGCCIVGFVTTNRFGFALEGTRCSFERLYYDSKYGQLKETYPKWEGFDKVSNYLEYFNNFNKSLSEKENIHSIVNGYEKSNINNYYYDGYYLTEYLNKIENLVNDKNALYLLNKITHKMNPILSRYGKMIDSMYKIQNLLFEEDLSLKNSISFFNSLKSEFNGLKENFLSEFNYYARVAKGWGKVLTMIYLCLLCITITFAAFSMMFYVCLKRQGYLSSFMHILWNIVRFFMFSFFFYGAAYGMCYLGLRDAVAYTMFIFSEKNLDANGYNKLIPKGAGREFLEFCLIKNNSNFINRLDPVFTSSLNDFFTNYQELKELLPNYEAYDMDNKIISDIIDKIEDRDVKTAIGEIILLQKTMIINKIKGNDFKDFKDNDIFCGNDEHCKELGKMAIKDGGLFGSFNCTFLKSDLNMMYRTLYDLSVEARILCALSCCIGFFGAIFVYFFLFVLHHYNNELFFDNGKNIFTGFEGVGNTKKRDYRDPLNKKRKLRNEIELSSRNEEYQPANKNDD